jgi:hypothetical protein
MSQSEPRACYSERGPVDPRGPRLTLIADLEAHLTSGAGDDAKRGFVVTSVQVFSLRVHDIHHLFSRNFANLRFVRLFGAGRNVGRFLQQHGCRRTLGYEGERLIFEDGDNDGENITSLFLSSGVKFLAECHDVDSTRSESGTDGRRRVRLPRGDLQFDVSDNFLSHKNLDRMDRIYKI